MGVVNSDPAHRAALTTRGKVQARQLGAQLGSLNIDLGVATRFPRTQQTLKLVLHGRRVPTVTEPGFDEIRAGDFDGRPVEEYWAWKEHHPWHVRLPHGESVDEALLRYAAALRRLLARTEAITVVVLHEFVLHRIAVAAASDTSLFADATFDNAVPYLFDQSTLGRAAAGLEALARAPGPTEVGRRWPPVLR